MLNLKSALLASICLLPLLAGEALAATAGVTAAVNQNAKSIPPGGAVRTIVLGDNVVQDETIETDAGGLVQILLADGTTFTVGPNSSLVIDRFVYDPDANTAEVAASLGRGVFRFIGGRTSKTEGGVTLNTPVGTVGIRGGMVDLNFTQGANGQIAQIDLLFGNEVTLGTDKVFTPGYSIIIGANGQPNVVKTPPGSASIIQQALAGRPGASGGTSDQPTDDDVENSEVGETNSGTTPPNPPRNIPAPDLRAIELATPKPNDNHQVAEEVTPDGPKTLNGEYYGYASASVSLNGSVVPEFYRNILPDEVTFNFNQQGQSVSGTISVAGTESVGTLAVAFGPEHGGSAIYYDDLYYYGIGPASGVDFGNAVTPSEGGTYVLSLGLGGADPECGCSFIQLGYWLTAADAGLESVDAIGTFVVGDITTDEEYEDLITVPTGSASYSGVAVGFLTTASATEAAVGNLYMEYDLDNRLGWMEVSNFGSVQAGFTGALDGIGASLSFYGAGTDGDTNYQADGSFVSDGSNPTAGVIGCTKQARRPVASAISRQL